MNYHQLTREERYQIKVLLQTGQNRSQIALAIGVDKSTISRELARNEGQRGYRPEQANEMAKARRLEKIQPQISKETWQMIEDKLHLDWSPEQITGWLLKNNQKPVSHEHIYQHVYADQKAGGELYKHLRYQKKRRRKRSGKYDRRGIIPDRKSIDERPEIVEQRERLGDWEGDLIIGQKHQGAVLTLVERKSRFTLIRRVEGKQALPVANAMIECLKWVPAVETITNDNGKEFAGHKIVSTALSANVYFAHPYSSWERGTNENTNGLIRQYLPKHRDLSTITAKEELMIMDRINLRPRKCLNFSTPFEVFFGLDFVALTT
jgi:transposase, IS30 family